MHEFLQHVKRSIRQFFIDYDFIVCPETDEYKDALDLCVVAYNIVVRWQCEADDWSVNWCRFYTPVSVDECAVYLESCYSRLKELRTRILARRMEIPQVSTAPTAACYTAIQKIYELNDLVFPQLKGIDDARS